MNRLDGIDRRGRTAHAGVLSVAMALLTLLGGCAGYRYSQPSSGNPYAPSPPMANQGAFRSATSTGTTADAYTFESLELAASSGGGGGWSSGDGLFGGGSRVRRAAPVAPGAAPMPVTPAPMEPSVPPPLIDLAGVGGSLAGPPVESSPQPTETSASESPRTAPLLIYTGRIVLAIFNVTESQERALALVEAMGGYSAQRSGQSMVFRVPAERFREALEQLAALGDVLSLDWKADDVSDQFRDLQIRLRNATEMRARLEALLQRAERVEDALQIEQQLERITLDIERIRGELRSLGDRIAFSTIEVAFSPMAVTQVPGNDYRLPFPWLNRLGLEFLLQL